MGKILSNEVSEKVKDNSELFLKKLTSDMFYKSEFMGNTLSFDWLNELEFACPYIDNTVRKPKLILINEESVVKIEKVKKITVDSVKDLSRHTHFIDKVDKKTGDVQPNKILEVRSEETYNIYENRFIYTLIDMMNKFVMEKEDQLKNIDVRNSKVLEYAGTSINNDEKVSIELKITSEELPKDDNSNNLNTDMNDIKKRISRVKDYIGSWYRSEMIKALQKEHAPFILPPIKKTNIILKNPNFQIAVKLWGYLYNYNSDDTSKGNLDSTGSDILRGVLDHTFLLDYFVLDSVCASKREQKERLSEYAVLIINEEIKRAISILGKCGVQIEDEEILAMIAKELKEDKGNRVVGANDVKKKFKSAMEEYIERTQDYL